MHCLDCECLLFDGFTFCCYNKDCNLWSQSLFPSHFVYDSDDDFINQSVEEAGRLSDLYDAFMMGI